MDIFVTLFGETLSHPLRGSDGRGIEDMSIVWTLTNTNTPVPMTKGMCSNW